MSWQGALGVVVGVVVVAVVFELAVGRRDRSTERPPSGQPSS